MKKDINKEMIINFFNSVESLSGGNAVEYFELGTEVIKPTRILEWLKSVDKYNESRYNNKPITDENLCEYSFLDLENQFAYGKFSEDYNTGYELAAEFLLSNYCSEEQLKWFINELIAYELDTEDNPEDFVWCDKVKEEQADFLEKVNK